MTRSGRSAASACRTVGVRRPRRCASCRRRGRSAPGVTSADRARPEAAAAPRALLRRRSDSPSQLDAGRVQSRADAHAHDLIAGTQRRRAQRERERDRERDTRDSTRLESHRIRQRSRSRDRDRADRRRLDETKVESSELKLKAASSSSHHKHQERKEEPTRDRNRREEEKRSTSSSRTRHDKKSKKKKRKKSRRRSSSSSSNTSTDSFQLLLKLEEERKRQLEETKKRKEVMKPLETPEEKRVRRLAKKEEKERRRKERMGWDNEYLHYTNTDNPFGDHSLLDTFMWKKKLEKDGMKDITREDLERINRLKQEENKRELEKVTCTKFTIFNCIER